MAYIFSPVFLSCRQVLDPKIHWFFYGEESPELMTYWDPEIAEIRYHHSITYHSEADIELPYGKYSPYPPDQVTQTQRDWSANKTALVAWMCSNCNKTYWPRLEFVNELKRHIQVDVYGACGKAKCLPDYPIFSGNCTHVVERYKFYLALENSECDEYISEKPWQNSLAQGAVPVVYGGRKAGYQKHLPPKSFIHAGDFDSPKDLAAYLLFLHANNTMYNAYHAWRNLGSLQATQYPPLDPQVFCKVVPFTFFPPPPLKTVKDSAFYKGCRNVPGVFAAEGSIKSFVPWK